MNEALVFAVLVKIDGRGRNPSHQGGVVSYGVRSLLEIRISKVVYVVIQMVVQDEINGA